MTDNLKPISEVACDTAAQGGVIADFDVAGLVGIRLVDARPDDEQMVTRQLGLQRVDTLGVPEVTVRFTDNLPTPKLQFLGLETAGFNEDGFYLLGLKSGTVDARIPFEAIGGHCEVICRRGLDEVPLLVDVVTFAFLQKDYVALHASAFLYEGKRVLILGWASGGKTEALLAFGNHGARYIGDELILISGDGQRMLGIPIPLAIRDWEYKYLNNMNLSIGLGQKIAFKGIRTLDAAHQWLGRGRLKDFPPVRFLGRALPMLRRQLKGWHLPGEVFGDAVDTEHFGPDKVFLMMSHDDPATVVERCDSSDVAQRMKSSNEYERSRFFQLYRTFKFAFPDASNAFLEEIDARQGALLVDVLRDKDTYRARHPNPVHLDELFERMRPFVLEESGQA